MQNLNVLLSRSLSYAKIVQGERSTKRKPKSFHFVLPSRLFYVKTAQGTNLDKLQFNFLIWGAGPHLGATRPRVGIC